jgi:hypothetical protein
VSESIDNILADLFGQNQLNPLALGGPDDRLALLYGGGDLLQGWNLDAHLLALNVATNARHYDRRVLAFSAAF